MSNQENDEPTNREILTIVQKTQKDVQDTQREVHNTQNEVHNTQNEVQDLLTAINIFSTNTEERFENIEGDIKMMKGDITTIKATMVTKEYLDDKLADLKGDLVVLVRKEDRKLASLIDILVRKSVISESDAKNVLSLEPFPQFSAQS